MVAGAGAGVLAYAAGFELHRFTLRRVEVPVLPPGAGPVRVLHLSDLHLLPNQRAKQAWLSHLGALQPDLVVDTGDNIASPDGVGYVVRNLGRLLDVPGVFVWGSNDYFAPQSKNPLAYLRPSRGRPEPPPVELPWTDLREQFQARGWVDLTNRSCRLTVAGVRIALRGTDDAHLDRDDYGALAGPTDLDADVAIGVTHAPYLRVLDAMTVDGHNLILAGHTHGGQVCVPFYGALVTNCDLDTQRAKGLSSHSAGGRTAALHVSAGLGTSPFAPVRFACPPEATLLTLTARPG